jgi:hypothetical protein
MSQQGPDVAKRNKKRKLKPARPLLEQVPAVPAEAPEQQHKHKKPHRQQQPPEQPQEQQPDALNAGNSKFARALGSTDFHTREQGLQALSRWLTHKQLVSELDMLKLWKGIYFCFWHSDKEPVQVRRSMCRPTSRLAGDATLGFWSQQAPLLEGNAATSVSAFSTTLVSL